MAMVAEAAAFREAEGMAVAVVAAWAESEGQEAVTVGMEVAVKASERMATRQVARVVASEAVKVGVAVEGASTVAPKAGWKEKVVVGEAVACQAEDFSAATGTVGVPGTGHR
tara:strand:- start:372 stop:707 length:336 start_codon:yes stop_codon:yes gene_type:complete